MRYGLLLLALIGLWFVAAWPAAAQEVTADEVNEIASRMYCPVCENIPLDACGTAACNDWRYEIRLMLEEGMTEEEIRIDFVDRFGDRVLGTPLNPVLRALSLVTPWLLAIAVLGVAVRLFSRWGQQPSVETVASTTPAPETDPYRSRLEQDIQGSL